jgi:hypothetical protein
VHIPLFMDGTVFRHYRERPCVDGSLFMVRGTVNVTSKDTCEARDGTDGGEDEEEGEDDDDDDNEEEEEDEDEGEDEDEDDYDDEVTMIMLVMIMMKMMLTPPPPPPSPPTTAAGPGGSRVRRVWGVGGAPCDRSHSRRGSGAKAHGGLPARHHTRGGMGPGELLIRSPL